MNPKNKYHVPNLERALVILEVLAKYQDGLTLTELTDITNFSKNSVFRITATLLNHDYLRRDEEGKRFTLTQKFLILGYASICEYSLVEKSIDIMRELRDTLKETVLIGTIVQNEGIVLEQVPGTHPFKFMADIGLRIPLHTSAPTKAMLAFYPEIQQNSYIDTIQFTAYTARTLTSREALSEELKIIKDTGYALDRAEQMDGVHCIAAPIFNHHQSPIAAIWTTGPSTRLLESAFQEYGAMVKASAEAISNRL